MEALAALVLVAFAGIAVAVIRTIQRQRAQAEETGLGLFLPILDTHISEWIELIAEDRLDVKSSQRKAEERGIDSRMMYVMDLAEKVLSDHGHTLDVDDIYDRAQGVYEELRSKPGSPLYRPVKPKDDEGA